MPSKIIQRRYILPDHNYLNIMPLKRHWGSADIKNVIFWGIRKPSSYFTGDTLLLRYRAELVNAM
jgi:hypothetical protein